MVLAVCVLLVQYNHINTAGRTNRQEVGSSLNNGDGFTYVAEKPDIPKLILGCDELQASELIRR